MTRSVGQISPVIAALLCALAAPAPGQVPATPVAEPPAEVPLPRLPAPDVGEEASAVTLLRAAEGALAAGRLGEAQEALEMAQTRLLDRSVPLFQTNVPSDNKAVALIAEARRALLSGDRLAAVGLIQEAARTLGNN